MMKFFKLVTLAAGFIAAGAASAAGTAIDVSAVVTSISDQAAPVALIGGAVLVLAVGVKAFKWVRSALS